MRNTVLIGALALVSLLLGGIGTASAYDPGDISALGGGGNDYCVSENGQDSDGTPGGCVDGKGLGGGISALQVSPDGKRLFVLGFDSFSGSGPGDSITAFDRSASRGSVTVDPRINACRSAFPTTDCSQGGSQATHLRAPNGLAISPDSKQVYVSARRSSSVTVFDYIAVPEDQTGQQGPLSRKAAPNGCLTDAATVGCTDALALSTASDVVISPDGNTVYTAGRQASGGGIAVFDRASDGVLTQKAGTAACVNDNGGNGCADGNHLEPTALTISSDGNSLYAASQDEADNDSVTVFDIDQSDGAITQKAGIAGCFTESGSSGACTTVSALGTPTDISITPDGKNVYVTSIVGSDDGPMTVFDRNTTTGALTRTPGSAGCFNVDGDGGCTEAPGIFRPFGVTATDEAVYVSSSGDGVSVPRALSIFNRNTSDGTLTQKPFDGCWAADELDGCVELPELGGLRNVAVSPDGDSLYAGGAGITVFNRNDGTLPDTTINSGPTGDTTSTSPSFTFSADKPNVFYECSIDSTDFFQECTSPMVYNGLSLGQHTFRVRATDVFEQAETTPAERTFTVIEGVDPPDPTCETDPSLCPPVPTCETDPSLCPDPPDTTVSATVTAAKVQKVKGKKIQIKLKVKANEAVAAKVSGSIKKGRLKVPLKSSSRKIAGGAVAGIVVAAKSAKQGKKLAAALKGGKTSVAKVLIVLTDGESNTKTVKPKIKIKGAAKRR